MRRETMRDIFTDLSDFMNGVTVEVRKYNVDEIKKELTKLDDVVEIGIALGIYKSVLDFDILDCDEDELVEQLDVCVALWKQYDDVVVNSIHNLGR
jgi:hypothetical protein